MRTTLPRFLRPGARVTRLGGCDEFVVTRIDGSSVEVRGERGSAVVDADDLVSTDPLGSLAHLRLLTRDARERTGLTSTAGSGSLGTTVAAGRFRVVVDLAPDRPGRADYVVNVAGPMPLGAAEAFMARETDAILRDVVTAIAHARRSS